MEDSNQIVIFGEEPLDSTLKARSWPDGSVTFHVKGAYDKASVYLNLEQTRELKQWLDVNTKRRELEKEVQTIEEFENNFGELRRQQTTLKERYMEKVAPLWARLLLGVPASLVGTMLLMMLLVFLIGPVGILVSVGFGIFCLLKCLAPFQMRDRRKDAKL